MEPEYAGGRKFMQANEASRNVAGTASTEQQPVRRAGDHMAQRRERHGSGGAGMASRTVTTTGPTGDDVMTSSCYFLIPVSLLVSSSRPLRHSGSSPTQIIIIRGARSRGRPAVASRPQSDRRPCLTR